MTTDSTAHPIEEAPGDAGSNPALAVLRRLGESGTSPTHEDVHLLAAGAAAIRAWERGAFARSFTSLLVLPHPIPVIEALADRGLLADLLPEVEALRHMRSDTGRHKDVWRHTLLVVARIPPDPISRLAALLHDIGKPPTKTVERGGVRFPGHAEVGAEMARRRMQTLAFDKDVTEAVTLLVALHLRINSYEDEWTDSAARRLARDAGTQFERLLQLSRADVTSARREMVARALRRVDLIEARVQQLRDEEHKPVSPIDGAELMAVFARPPGRWIGHIKDRLAELVGSGALGPADRDGALRIAKELIEGMG